MDSTLFKTTIMDSKVQESWQELDFKNEGEMWFTEIIIYICFILIWYLLLKTLWFFCISPHSPRFRQYDARALKPIKAKAEQSRIRRQSELTNSATTTSLNEPNNTRVSSTSRTVNESQSNASNKGETAEEFQLQICKIHRSLRMCFVTSLICTSINVTSIMLNHTLIISGVISRDCIISRLPVTANFCQRLALYLFFIFRLHYSFGATQFGIKPIYIWCLIIAIITIGGLATAYFFIIIISASDPCELNVADASFPAVGQDLFFNLLLSALFLSRLGAAVKSQSKFKSSRNIHSEKAKLKEAKANYKYYYTMYKLTCLFIVAFIVTVSGLVIIIITGLAGGLAAIDSVVSNYLLFLSFQFNDNYFRIVFCGCLKIQSLFLGDEYAKEMELHFITNAKKPSHRQSSQTWQNQEIETTNTKQSGAVTMNKIEEEPNNIKGINGKMTVVVTADDNDNNQNDEPIVKRMNTVDSDISNDLTVSNENTPIDNDNDNDNDNDLTISNENGLNAQTPIDDETEILARADTEVP